MSDIDHMMEQASQKLLAVDYLGCEKLCMQALERAASTGNYERIARILLPLQEARRHRRQIAVEAGVKVLAEPRLTPAQIIERYKKGCLMLLSPPYSIEDEQAIRQMARENGSMLEVLVVNPDGLRAGFEQLMERTGDAAVAALSSDLSAQERVKALSEALERVGDHEIAHQRLAEAAREAVRGASDR